MSDPKPLRFRLTPRQRAPLFIIAAVALPVTLMIGPNVFSLITWGFMVVGVMQVFLASTSVGRDELMIHTGYRYRKIHRNDVRDLQIQTMGRTRRIVLVTDKARLALAVPTDGRLGRNPDFDRQSKILMDWWKGRLTAKQLSVP